MFVPIFLIFHEKALPYFFALAQHALIGDYLSGSQIQILWPLTTKNYGMEIGIGSQANIVMEWAIFLASMLVMFKTKDYAIFFKENNSNIFLAIPALTIFLPTFLDFPLNVPIWLIPPHLTYAFIFLASIIIVLFKILRKLVHRNNNRNENSTKNTTNSLI